MGRRMLEGQLLISGRSVWTLAVGTLQWRMLEALIAAEAPLTPEALYTGAWGLPFRPPSSMNTLYVALSRLRRKLAGTGLSVINTAGDYHLEPAGVAELRDRPRPASAPKDLFGREDALAALGAALARARVVCVCGAAGVGKTRLVQAHLSTAALSTAAWVELAGIREASQLPAMVAVSLGLDAGRVDGDAIERLLGDLSVPLVLDNLEHLLPEARPILERWCAAVPGLQLVLTSRERTGFSGEALVPLAPLSAEDAVEMFVSRVARVRGSYTPSASEQRVLRQVVDRLDHLPLAIELTAPRMAMMSAADLCARMAHRWPQYTAQRHHDPRYRSVEEAIAWSWERLPGDARETLVRCSLFADRFTLPDLEAVGGTEEALMVLCRRSLVHTEPAHGQLSLRLLSTVRAYVNTQRSASDNLSALHHEHAAWALARARAVTDTVIGDALDQLEVLLPDLLVVIDRIPETAAGLEARLRAAQLLVVRGPFGMIPELMEALRQEAHRLPRPQQVEALLLVARIDWVQGRSGTPQAQQALSQAAAIAAEDPALVARVHYHTGLYQMLQWQQRDLASARFRQARALAEETGQPWLVAVSLQRLGVLASWAGDASGALPLLEEAVARLDMLGDRLALASALGNLGSVARVLGLPSAEAYFRRGLKEAQALGAIGQQGRLGGNLANLYNKLGRWSEAVPCYTEAIARLEQANDHQATAVMLGNLAGIYIHLGETGRAREMLRRARLLAADTPELWRYRLLWKSTAGMSLLNDGQDDLAAVELMGALEDARELDNPVILSQMLWPMGYLHLLQGRTAESQTLFAEYAAHSRACRNQEHSHSAAIGLALTDHLQGNTPRAVSTIRRVLSETTAGVQGRNIWHLYLAAMLYCRGATSEAEQTLDDLIDQGRFGRTTQMMIDQLRAGGPPAQRYESRVIARLLG